MKWRKFSGVKAYQPLIELVERIQNCECGVVYAPLPEDATIKIIIFPDWQTRATLQSSLSGNREVMRFNGVSGVNITTLDTLTVGHFTKLECETVGERVICTVFIRGADGNPNKVEFSFADCELNVGLSKDRQD